MTKEFEDTNAPVIGRRKVKVGRFVEIDQTDSGSLDLIMFEKELMVFTQTESCFRLTVDDETIRASQYNDFYGFLTSIADPMDMAVDWMKKHPDTKGVFPEVIISVKEFLGVPYAPSDDEKKFRMLRNRTPYKAIPIDWLDLTDHEAVVAARSLLAARSRGEFAAAVDFGIRHVTHLSTSSEHVLWRGIDDPQTRKEKFIATITDLAHGEDTVASIMERAKAWL